MGTKFKQSDMNLYKSCEMKLRQVNEWLEPKKYKYEMYYNKVLDEYILRGTDNLGRVLFVRTFTYCDRLLNYLSGMCNAIELSDLETRLSSGNKN